MLAAEATPTLCFTIPSFAAFIDRWEELLVEDPGLRTIVQPGLDKLITYEGRITEETPAYTVAMGKLLSSLNYYLLIPDNQLWILTTGSNISVTNHWKNSRMLNAFS